LSTDLILREPLGERIVGAAEFPLAIGCGQDYVRAAAADRERT